MMKKLHTIQPIKNLQNYSKNIIPVIKSGKSVHLTKHGRNDLVISADNQSSADKLKSKKEHVLKEELSAIVENKLEESNKSKGYTANQLKKMVNKFE